MLNRRQFLSASAAGAAFLLPTGVGPLSRRARAAQTSLSAPIQLPGANFPKYVDPLPIPPVFNTHTNNYLVGMRETLAPVLPSTFRYPAAFPGTTVWSYYDKTNFARPSGTYLGPTVVAYKDVPKTITWYNELPSRFLPTLDSTSYSVVDQSLMGMGGMGANTFGAGAAVVHLHGAHVRSADDGLPWQWFAPGDRHTSTYPNDQPGSLLWYHDHAMGMTRLNVFAGLAGAYLLIDPTTEPANLPSGRYDLPLVIQDRMFDTNGQFYYPINPLMGTGGSPSPWPGPSVPEFFGDTILVNGKVWPTLTVEARRYRFRILNGSQSRFYDLSITDGKRVTPPVFVQIGAEGGYLPAPAVLQNLLVAPAERADVIVDFTGLAGQTFLLSNDANAPYPGGDSPDRQTTAQVMQFVVVPPTSVDLTDIPATLPGPDLRGTPSLPPVTPITEVVLFEQLINGNSVRLQLGPGGGPLGGYPFDEWMASPLQLTGGWNTIRFINTTGDVHPMHTHLFMFQVLQRQAFQAKYTPSSGNYPPSVAPYLIGQPSPAAANEKGLKDTVQVNPGEIADVLAYVDPAASGQTYVLHCHILEHEEKDMMLAYTVV